MVILEPNYVNANITYSLFTSSNKNNYVNQMHDINYLKIIKGKLKYEYINYNLNKVILIVNLN